MKKFASIFLVIGGLYLIGPIIAGALNSSSVRGPAIYPEGLHVALFSKSFEFCRDDIPKDSPTELLYYREFFYGFQKKPKPREQRDKIVSDLDARIRSESVYLDVVRSENGRLNQTLR